MPKPLPRECALVAPDQNVPATVKNVAVIVNPNAGVKGAKSNLQICQEVWKAAGITVKVLETEYAGHARVMGRDMDLSDLDALCVIGGDGSMHELVNGFLSRSDGKSVPIGLIPGGSGNALMCDLGTWDVHEAAERVAKGLVCMVDVNLVETCGEALVSTNGVFFGLVGDVGILAESYRCLGPARYDAVAVWGLLKGYRQTVTLHYRDANDELFTLTDEFLTCFVNLTQHFGKGLRAAPDARLDDGLMDLVCVKTEDVTRGELLAIFQQLPTGAHHSSDLIEFIQCKEVELEFEGPGVFNIDGEVCQHDGTLKITAMPRRIAMFGDTNTVAGDVV